MIAVTNVINTVEEDDCTTAVQMTVESHPVIATNVILRIGDECVAVDKAELEAAIKNAANTGKIPRDTRLE